MFEPNCDSEFFDHDIGVDEVTAWFAFNDSKLSFTKSLMMVGCCG